MIAIGCAGGCASRTSIPASSGSLTLPADLYRPDGNGPFPAVVLLAPCGGVTAHMGDWAEWLKDQGYVALVVDSFTPRGARNACQGGIPSPSAVGRDAVDGLVYLRTLPFVDAKRVAVMGWSHGGAAALDASGRPGLWFGPGEQPAFRAAVAFYPPCQFLSDDTRTPTLLLLAGRDDWTPIGPCLALGELARRRDRPVSWEVYPDAQHAFDRPGARPDMGYTMAYD